MHGFVCVSWQSHCHCVLDCLLGTQAADRLASALQPAFSDSASDDDGNAAGALHLFQEVLAARRMILGSEHPLTMSSIGNLAVSHHRKGEYRQAVDLLKEELRLCSAVHGRNHTSTLCCMNNLASTSAEMGDYAAGISAHEAVLERSRTPGAVKEADLLLAIHNLAMALLQDLGDTGAAMPLCTEAVKRSRRLLGRMHPKTQQFEQGMASTLDHIKQANEEDTRPVPAQLIGLTTRADVDVPERERDGVAVEVLSLDGGRYTCRTCEEAEYDGSWPCVERLNSHAPPNTTMCLPTANLLLGLTTMVIICDWKPGLVETMLGTTSAAAELDELLRTRIGGLRGWIKSYDPGSCPPCQRYPALYTVAVGKLDVHLHPAMCTASKVQKK